MNSKTAKNDPINRGDEGHSELKNVIIIAWLDLGSGNITFGDELDFEIAELDVVYKDDETTDD